MFKQKYKLEGFLLKPRNHIAQSRQIHNYLTFLARNEEGKLVAILPNPNPENNWQVEDRAFQDSNLILSILNSGFYRQVTDDFQIDLKTQALYQNWDGIYIANSKDPSKHQIPVFSQALFS